MISDGVGIAFYIHQVPMGVHKQVVSIRFEKSDLCFVLFPIPTFINVSKADTLLTYQAGRRQRGFGRRRLSLGCRQSRRTRLAADDLEDHGDQIDAHEHERDVDQARGINEIIEPAIHR